MGVPATLAELESNAGTQSCPRVVRALLEVVVGAP
jgi:HD-GYP domain-containing protein (c-di-GMP phosphodiesterase class II)